MSPYLEDRKYTDYIHQVALNKIYRELAWTQINLEQQFAQEIDMQKGIDYIFKDDEDYLKTVQERFREAKYHQYSDFTIRYRRDNNANESRKESEYYKMKAAYFTYGISNCMKGDLSKCTDFLKFAVIDMKKVYEKIDEGLIIITNNKERICTIDDAKIICPILYNKDGSSSFFPIEISFLVKLWGSELIILQKGFL